MTMKMKYLCVYDRHRTHTHSVRFYFFRFGKHFISVEGGERAYRVPTIFYPSICALSVYAIPGIPRVHDAGWHGECFVLVDKLFKFLANILSLFGSQRECVGCVSVSLYVPHRRRECMPRRRGCIDELK